MRMY